MYTKEEQQKHREKWVEALRSGKYVQGYGRLKGVNDDESDAFCCLGVACDMYPNGEFDQINTFYYTNSTGTRDHENFNLPYPLEHYLGITTIQAVDLSTMNDDGATFNEIADIIESY